MSDDPRFPPRCGFDSQVRRMTDEEVREAYGDDDDDDRVVSWRRDEGGEWARWEGTVGHLRRRMTREEGTQ